MYAAVNPANLKQQAGQLRKRADRTGKITTCVPQTSKHFKSPSDSGFCNNGCLLRKLFFKAVVLSDVSD